MCYSMRCVYQNWHGECRIGGNRFPADAACMMDEEEESYLSEESSDITDPNERNENHERTVY